MRETWRVTGEVQGVGFRWRSRQAAAEAGAEGRGENLNDGSVRLTLEGERAATEAARRAIALWYPEAEWRLERRE